MRLAVSWQLGLELVLDVEQAQAGLFSWQAQHVKLAVHSDPERLDVLGVSQKRKTGLATVLNISKTQVQLARSQRHAIFSLRTGIATAATAATTVVFFSVWVASLRCVDPWG